MLSKVIISVVVMAAVCASILWYGGNRWDLATTRLVATIDASRAPGSVTHYDARELDGLPPPVQRYFRAVSKEGQPIITSAVVEHVGTFNSSATAARRTRVGNHSQHANGWSLDDRDLSGMAA